MIENGTIFQGENLDVLRGMNSESVDLITTDPPYNKGRDFYTKETGLYPGASFPDRWTWNDAIEGEWLKDVEHHPALVKAIEGAFHSHSPNMAGYMCWISARLIEMHRILKPTGVITLQYDHTAARYVWACLDAIFGEKNYVNDVIWFYNDTPGGRTSNRFPRKHDHILVYSKIPKNHKFNKDAVAVPVKEASLKRYETAREIGGRSYVGGSPTKTPEDVWTDPAVKKNAGSKLGVNYPTQKPISVYKRLIDAFSDRGDMVLDPFCGCGTSVVAAEISGRKWAGIDIWEEVHAQVKVLMKKTISLGASKIICRKDIPVRTDGNSDTPRLIPKNKYVHLSMSREQMMDLLVKDLLEYFGKLICVGCGYEQPTEKVFQLDHGMPKTDGGSDLIGNRMLLCSYCNGKKRHLKTYSSLVKSNKEEGYHPDGADFAKLKKGQKYLMDRARQHQDDFYKRHHQAKK